jgi:ribosomal protein S18 acetylase RimI-like enzyme
METIAIEHYQPSDFDAIKSFVESIQEYERALVPELKPGTEIGLAYTTILIDTIVNQEGIVLVAKVGSVAIGFACAWIDSDDDPLLSDAARSHAYVSDLFVDERYRRRGVARLLLEAIDNEMLQRGCKRIRICTKAFNHAALNCYQANGYSAYEIILCKTLAT